MLAILLTYWIVLVKRRRQINVLQMRLGSLGMFISNSCVFSFAYFRDLLGTFGASILPVLERDSITVLLNKARRSKLTKAKTLANYAMKEMRTMKAVAASLQSAMPTTSGGGAGGQNGGMALVQ
jgi:hypothetical protein